MTDISAEDWERIRMHFGNLCYEHPELHAVMLDILGSKDPDTPEDEVELE